MACSARAIPCSNERCSAVSRRRLPLRVRRARRAPDCWGHRSAGQRPSGSPVRESLGPKRCAAETSSGHELAGAGTSHSAAPLSLSGWARGARRTSTADLSGETSLCRQCFLPAHKAKNRRSCAACHPQIRRGSLHGNVDQLRRALGTKVSTSNEVSRNYDCSVVSGRTVRCAPTWPSVLRQCSFGSLRSYLTLCRAISRQSRWSTPQPAALLQSLCWRGSMQPASLLHLRDLSIQSCNGVA